MSRPRLFLMVALALAATTFTMCCKQTRTASSTNSAPSGNLAPGRAAQGQTDTASRSADQARIESVLVKTGIAGKVEIWEGNFMPMVDPERRANQIKPGAGRRVRVYQPVRMSGGMTDAKRAEVPTSVVAEVMADSTGRFSVAVPPGTYSVFVEEGGGWYANSWNDQGIQGAATVEDGKVTETLIKITTKATF